MHPDTFKCRPHKFFKACLAFSLLVVLVYFYRVGSLSIGILINPRLPKRILFWTKYWGSQETWRYNFIDMSSGRCASDCVLLFDRSELSTADAVVFNLNSYDLDPAQLPTSRRPAGQIWVLYSIESPAHEKVKAINLTALNGLFNWTMTYRQDSDLPMPYGLVLPSGSMSGIVSRAFLPKTVRQALPRRPAFQRGRRPAVKKRLVSWMVSKCHTPGGREEYVRQLQQHVQVSTPSLETRSVIL